MTPPTFSQNVRPGAKRETAPVTPSARVPSPGRRLPRFNEALHECFYPLTLGRDFQTAWRNAVTPHRVEEALLRSRARGLQPGRESDGRADRCLSKTYGLEESEPVTQGAAWTMYSMRGRARRRRIRGEDLRHHPLRRGWLGPALHCCASTSRLPMLFTKSKRAWLADKRRAT